MPHLDKLLDELSTPKRDCDNAGRVKVESKKDLSKRDVASPNIADAFIMAFVQMQPIQAQRIQIPHMSR
jgi:phage terminase large subunit